MTRPTPREEALARIVTGTVIEGVTVESDGTPVVHILRGKSRYHLHVMCDPEGNGPGALHVYQITDGGNGYVGPSILGGN